MTEFAMQFRAGTRIDVPKLRAYLGLRDGEFAALLRVHRNTLLNTDNRKAQVGALAVIRALSAFAAAAVGKDEAWPAFHFRNRPLRAIGYRTACEALSAGGDVEAVVDAIADSARV